jgi:hypothetical protein
VAVDREDVVAVLVVVDAGAERPGRQIDAAARLRLRLRQVGETHPWRVLGVCVDGEGRPEGEETRQDGAELAHEPLR